MKVHKYELFIGAGLAYLSTSLTIQMNARFFNEWTQPFVFSGSAAVCFFLAWIIYHIEKKGS